MKRYFPLIIAVVQLACTDFGENVPPQVPLRDLLSAPETVSVAGKPLILTTELQRDFMPSVPPTGSQLFGVVYVQTTDSTQPPNSASADVVWVVYRQQIWASYLLDSPLSRPNAIVKHVSNGPEWDGPVDVIVRLSSSSITNQLLRASNQAINKTY